MLAEIPDISIHILDIIQEIIFAIKLLLNLLHQKFNHHHETKKKMLYVLLFYFSSSILTSFLKIRKFRSKRINLSYFSRPAASNLSGRCIWKISNFARVCRRILNNLDEPTPFKLRIPHFRDASENYLYL